MSERRSPDGSDDNAVTRVAHDLRDEAEALDAIVADLPDEHWALPTPSPGWTIADQIAHLAFFDDTAATAIVDGDGFMARTAALFTEMGDGRTMDELTLGWRAELTASELLDRWRVNRQRLATAASTLTDDARIPWYGPSMGARSFVTARLMEAWAHGQDVVDALGITRPGSARLRHVAQIGVITRGWSYRNRGLDAPSGTVPVTLTAPSGDTWAWHDDAPVDEVVGTVTGPAQDFCLVVTQRRNLDDTDLVVDGAAEEWMRIAQAFAGQATDGPAPRT